MICKHILLRFLNKLKLIVSHTVPGIANNSFKHQSFVYIQLNDQKVLFQTIQFIISHLFALSLNVK